MVLSGVLRLQKLHKDGTYRVLDSCFQALCSAVLAEGCAIAALRRPRLPTWPASIIGLLWRSWNGQGLERTFFAAALDELDAAYELSSCWAFKGGTRAWRPICTA